MRLVCLADTHQFHDELVVPDGDVLVCAGDVGRVGDEHEIDRFLSWFAALPHRHKIFVPGNHDGCLEGPHLAAALAANPTITFLIDDGHVIHGVRFWGAPWTPVFFDWAFMLPRGPALAARWAKIPADTQVLITHGPPKHVLDDVSTYRYGGIAGDLADDDRFAGCADLRDRVRAVRPALHVFGHIHQGRGRHDGDGVVYVNCSTNECDHPPVVIDLDTAGGACRVTDVR